MREGGREGEGGVKRGVGRELRAGAPPHTHHHHHTRIHTPTPSLQPRSPGPDTSRGAALLLSSREQASRSSSRSSPASMHFWSYRLPSSTHSCPGGGGGGGGGVRADPVVGAQQLPPTQAGGQAGRQAGGHKRAHAHHSVGHSTPPPQSCQPTNQPINQSINLTSSCTSGSSSWMGDPVARSITSTRIAASHLA